MISETTMTAPLAEKPIRRRLSRLVVVASWMFLAMTLGAALLLNWAGDSSWPMTLLTFGPRWAVLVPLVPLTAGALAFRRRSVSRWALLPLLMGFCCALGPVMGFCVSWRSVAETEPDHVLALRIVTLNIDGETDVPGLIQFLKDVKPDVVAFQEGPFSASLLAELKDEFVMVGSHHLFVASRHPIVKGAASPKGQSRRQSPAICCDIATPAGVVHINCLHLCSLRSGFLSVIKNGSQGAPELERITAIRNEESQVSASFARSFKGPTLVLGDFNMPGDSTIFQRDWSDWQDAFSVRGFGFGYTFATNRIGLRIDHVLADKQHWHIRSCRVGPDLHGQHRPVVADLLLLNAE